MEPHHHTMSWITHEVNGYRPVGRYGHSAGMLIKWYSLRSKIAFSILDLHDIIVCYKGSLLVFGGICDDLKEAYNDFVVYEPGTPYRESRSFLNLYFLVALIYLWIKLDSRCWSQVETKGNGPCSRFYHSCVLIQDRVFVFGGFPSKKKKKFNHFLFWVNI